MTTTVKYTLAGFIVLAALVVGCSEKKADMTCAPQCGSGAATCCQAPVLRHVVLFKFKDDATAEQIQQVVDAFRALPDKIDIIKGFEYGTDVSPEKRAEGFTHCFMLTFATEADRDAYLPHPAHKEFGKILRPYLDKVLVVDYWTKK